LKTWGYIPCVPAWCASFWNRRTKRKFPTRWTQDEIARHIGTIRDVVGRSLRNLELEGFIQIQRQRIRLLDHPGLEKIANSE